MKALKKTLSLVLAVIMLVGVVSITAGAAFSDDDSINYDAEVGVLNGMGIIGGYPDGSFQPAKVLTRAQACKLIAYALLGEHTAENLKATAQVYDDVPTTHYAAAWIQYCTNKGIVSGVAEGRFNPDGDVTGYQFARMLLSALGYNADAAGYKGNGWEVNVAADAISNGLFEATSTVSLTLA